MQVVLRRTAPPAPAPYAAAEASFAETKAYLSSREALQMRESDLERELNRRGQELMRKLLQGHLDQRSPGEAAGPVEGADGVERSERRLHDRQLETTFGTVAVERLGYARHGHDSLHPLDASLNLAAECCRASGSDVFWTAIDRSHDDMRIAVIPPRDHGADAGGCAPVG